MQRKSMNRHEIEKSSDSKEADREEVIKKLRFWIYGSDTTRNVVYTIDRTGFEPLWIDERSRSCFDKV